MEGIGDASNSSVLFWRPEPGDDPEARPEGNTTCLKVLVSPLLKPNQAISQARRKAPTLCEPACVTTHTAR